MQNSNYLPDKGLKDFTEKSIDKDCSRLSGHHENELFFNCTFDKLNNLSLTNCDLNRSKFKTNSIKDALNFTLTLNCHSFDKVEFSPLLFDLFLVLATKTTGNDDKRRKLIEVVGEQRVNAINKILTTLE